jgi:hypothetical protein
MIPKSGNRFSDKIMRKKKAYAPSRTLESLLKALSADSCTLLSTTPPITAMMTAATQAMTNAFMELAPRPCAP